ncbi:MAG: MFS transporter [Dehalococcoidia bacterium]
MSSIQGTASNKPPLGRTFKAFGNRNYQLYWFGQFFSQVGTWMQSTALAWLVLSLTKSPFALGTVITVQFMPILLFALFGGVVADRVPKRKLLLTTQCVLLVQALVLATLTATGLIQLVLVYVLAAVQGTANAMDNPARQAFVVEMVGPEDLPNAIALNSTQLQLSRLLGPALGGIAIATIGVAGCFYLNAASFLAVIGGLIAMNPSRFFPGGALQKGNPLRQVRDGIGYAVTTPDIALVLLTLAALGTFGYNFSVFMPLIAKFVLHSGAVGFGILSSAMAVGSVVATLAIAYRGTATRRSLLIGGAGFSLLLFGVALSHWWLLTIPLLVAMGFSSSVFSATSNSRIQLVTPSHLRGRVMGIYFLLFAGTTPIGSLIVGTLAEREGVSAAIAEMAAMCGLGVVLAFIYLRRHRTSLLTDDEVSERSAQRMATSPARAATPSTPHSEPVAVRGG